MPDVAPVHASDPAPVVELARDQDADAWDAFVTSMPEACGYHEWAWRSVVTRAFGHESLYLVARRGGRIDGVLPLVQINSRLFGRSLTSLPFLNYGGVLAASDDTREALLEAAAGLARARRCAHVELRHVERQFASRPCRQHKVTMRLPLAGVTWETLDRKVRNQIRKAEKSALTVTAGGAELVDAFYTVFARNMRDLGTPVYAKRLFETVLDVFGDRTRLLVVYLQGEPIAAGLTYRTRATTEIPWASSIRTYNALCPNHLMYWHALQSAQKDGSTVFDFGRSTPGEGTYKFKEQWGASPVPLHWEYWLPDGARMPDQSPANPKFRAAIALWQRLPLWAANAIGPYIVRSIP